MMSGLSADYPFWSDDLYHGKLLMCSLISANLSGDVLFAFPKKVGRLSFMVSAKLLSFPSLEFQVDV